jgi:hypothetical protein
MDDVDKLDNIQDGFIHYQLLRFCQATRLQYLNGQITLANQNVLQQQHVDHKIANALLKKGALDIYKTWNHHDRAWVDMRLHESHDDGGFGVSNNTISRLAASYTTNARFVAFLGTFACPAQQVWLPGTDLQDPTSWDAPLRTLARRTSYTTTNALISRHLPRHPLAVELRPTQAHTQPQHAGSQDDGNGKLVLPQLNRLHEAFKRNQVPSSASSSSQDQQPNRPTPIPTQRRLTQQLTKHRGPFKALGQRYADTCFDEQRQLHLPQKHKATVQDSTLRVQMNALEEQADNAKARELFWKPMSWLGTIGPTSANDAFDPALWATFVSTTLGVGVPVLSSLSRLPKKMYECVSVQPWPR